MHSRPFSLRSRYALDRRLRDVQADQGGEVGRNALGMVRPAAIVPPLPTRASTVIAIL